MADRISRAHWRVQTETEDGRWVTRCHEATLPAAIGTAESYLAKLDVHARVVLNGVVYYTTKPVMEATA